MAQSSIASNGSGNSSGRVGALAFAALGVVFGDIGTSPLYAMKETFGGIHALPLDRLHVLGVLSLVFWSITLVVSIKYVVIIMRADNRGEGGSLALLALLIEAVAKKQWLVPIISTLGIFAAAMFYGDSIITPAISVLSAVEGLQVAAPDLEHYVLPLTLVILVLLFLIQRHGTGKVGSWFGPIMLIWFVAMAALGIRGIALRPEVLLALSPHYAAVFIAHDGWSAFLALGSVVLAVTGAEALYADMGHFGRLPIRLAWYLLVLPALLLNYFGQGGALLANPDTMYNPFFLIGPEWSTMPLVILATMATVIASQAVISGAFSITRQAIQLGYVPRMMIKHTSEKEMGQIYIPFLNWTLMIFVALLVLGFKTSSNLAAAYGLAVTCTMVIDTLLITGVMALLWKWPRRRIMIVAGLFMTVDLAFFMANTVKIPHGGWFPLALALVIFLLLTTWKKGRLLLAKRMRKIAIPVEDFHAMIGERVVRVPGTAIFLTAAQEGAPSALLHNLKHNKVLHERVVLLTVLTENVPYVPTEQRVRSEDLGNNISRVILRFGFMQAPNIPRTLTNAKADDLGFQYTAMAASFFLSREMIIPSVRPGMFIWREHLFAWMARNAAGAMTFFRLPTNQVIELGTQIEI